MKRVCVDSKLSRSLDQEGNYLVKAAEGALGQRKYFFFRLRELCINL